MFPELDGCQISVHVAPVRDQTAVNQEVQQMSELSDKTMGQKIRELREAAKLALRDVGDLLKDPATGTPVSAAFLSDIENGRRFPSDDLLGRLALVLRTNVAELRKCDQRPPSREIQDLALMNAQYAFAFRRAVEIVHEQKLSPQDVVRRLESDTTKEPTKES